MATCHSGYSPLWGAANDYKKDSCSLWPHAIPAIAQLVEHVSVGLCRNQMVPGSIPGGRIALLSHPPATSTGSDWTVLFVSLVSCLSAPLSAEGSGGQYFGKCGAGWFRRFLYTNLVELFLSKKRSKSSRPLWHAANDYKKNSCSLWPHAIPAIAQLVEHLTVDCAEIRWSLARFWVAGLLCFLILLPPPQAAIELCCLSALYLACPSRCLQRAREGSTLENVGRDDLGGFCTPILLSCSCQKNALNHPAPCEVQQMITRRIVVACGHMPFRL